MTMNATFYTPPTITTASLLLECVVIGPAKYGSESPDCPREEQEWWLAKNSKEEH